MISKCFYALDTLLQAIPTALDTGIGKPQIEKLRQEVQLLQVEKSSLEKVPLVL